jgi:RNA polymerase sigma-70 factor (ECF subfamily)
MAGSPADADLVRSAQDGDADALEELVRRHLGAVYGHALRFFGDPQTAEDAAQEVFVKVFRSLSEFDGRSSFSTWLYRVTRNVCLDMFRRSKRTAVPVDPLDLPQPAVADFADDVALSTALERAIRALQPEERDAFNAVALFGLSYQAAGEALGVPSGTVKSRVFRARRSLVGWLGLDSKDRS